MMSLNTPISSDDKNKVKDLLMCLNLPTYPVQADAGIPETKNETFSSDKYTAYATDSNIPAQFKGKTFAKATKAMKGYEGTVVSKKN